MTNPPTPDQIKRRRIAKDWTQHDLAAALIDATPEELARMAQFNATLVRVQRWEQGKQTPDRKNTRKLARILPPIDKESQS